MKTWQDILPKPKTIDKASNRRKLKSSQLFYNLGRKDCLDSLQQAEARGEICFISKVADLESLSIKIAELSATKDDNGEWWGDDTIIEDLPNKILKLLRGEK